MIGTLKKNEIIPLSFDIMFSEVFNNEDNICILEEFISGYFNYDLELVRGNLKILSRRLGKENRLDSRKEVDLLLDYQGNKINIEMSNYKSEGITDRNIIYLCKMHGKQLKVGDYSYSKINKSVQIVFNNFDCQEELRTIWYLRNERGKILSHKFRIDIINMEKGKKLCYTERDEDNYLVNWCKILTEINKENLKKASHKVLSKQSTSKLMDKIDILSGDDEMVKLYTKLSRREMEWNTLKEEAIQEGFKEGFDNGFQNGFQDGVNEGIQQGIEQGIEQGKKDSQKEIAINLLKSNVDIDIIMNSTRLTTEEIKILMKEIK